MNEADKRVYRIADNRLAELAGWDHDLLKIEFAFLSEIDIELSEITGFETAEIEIIADGSAPTTLCRISMRVHFPSPSLVICASSASPAFWGRMHASPHPIPACSMASWRRWYSPTRPTT